MEEGFDVGQKALLEQIEEALGIELYVWQRRYLLGQGGACGGRGSGKTLAYCVRLCITLGPPLDLRRLSEVQKLQDEWLGLYYSQWFQQYLRDIYCQLKEAGVPVRKIIF